MVSQQIVKLRIWYHSPCNIHVMNARDETQKLFFITSTTCDYEHRIFGPDIHGSSQLLARNHLSFIQAKLCPRGIFAVNLRKNSRKPHLLMQQIAANLLIYMVGREGFEPSTIGLKVRCSTN